jgi:ferredoxin-fold anticodon binding domain-containing protein
MREIKFRGQSTGDIGTWIYGYYHFDKSNTCHYICDIDSLVRYEVKPGTVGQFTGLQDKNGTDIYEGDIIDYGNGRNITITYEVNGFGFKFKHGHERCFLDMTKFEVIGNIHEHPQLLIN